MVYMWRSENKFWVSVLSFHCSFWGGHLASPSQLSLKPGTSTYQEIRGWDSGQGTIFLSLAWSFLVIFFTVFYCQQRSAYLPTSQCFLFPEDEKMETIQDGRECSLEDKQKTVSQDHSQIRGQKEEEGGFGELS